MNTGRTWDVLAQLGETKASDAMANLSRARKTLEDMQASEARLQELYADYSSRLQQQDGAVCSMSETKNIRNFMDHIENLREGMTKNRLIAESAVGTARRLHAEAEQYRVKMRGLADRAAEQLRREQEAAEAKRMDALAVSRYNFGRR